MRGQGSELGFLSEIITASGFGSERMFALLLPFRVFCSSCGRSWAGCLPDLGGLAWVSSSCSVLELWLMEWKKLHTQVRWNKLFYLKELVEVHASVHRVCVVVEGGQRAVIFNRIGGMQMNTVLAEGLHFRYHCWVWYFNLCCPFV